MGGIAAILGGVLFVAWGYVHRDAAPWYFDATAKALNFVVPALFYVALAGLYALCRESVDRIGKFGFILGLAGSAMGVAYAVPWSAFATRDDWLASLVWLDTPLMWWLQIMLVGLPLAGIPTMGARMQRGPGSSCSPWGHSDGPITRPTRVRSWKHEWRTWDSERCSVSVGSCWDSCS